MICFRWTSCCYLHRHVANTHNTSGWNSTHCSRFKLFQLNYFFIEIYKSQLNFITFSSAEFELIFMFNNDHQLQNQTKASLNILVTSKKLGFLELTEITPKVSLMSVGTGDWSTSTRTQLPRNCCQATRSAGRLGRTPSTCSGL